MIDQNQKKREARKNNFSLGIAAVVTGAVVGAGVAVVGAALQDEKKRKEIAHVFTDIKKKTAKLVDDMQNQAEEKQKVVAVDVKEGKEKVKQLVAAADDTKKEVKKIWQK